MTLEWMQRLVSKVETRECFKTPFCVTLEGKKWACVTDGVVLVAVQDDRDLLRAEFPPLPFPDTERVVKDFLIRTAPGDIFMTRLKAWAGDPCWPSDNPCPFCGGTGKVVCVMCGGNEHEEECPQCGASHVCVPCRGCNGEGRHRCPLCDGSGADGKKALPRYGKIAGVTIDRIRIARAIENLSGPVGAASAKGLGFLVMEGPGWKAFLMQVNAPGRSFPEFEKGES